MSRLTNSIQRPVQCTAHHIAAYFFKVFPSWSFLWLAVQRVCLLRTASVFGFAELGFSETLAAHRLSFALPAARGQFLWQRRPHLLPEALWAEACSGVSS